MQQTWQHIGEAGEHMGHHMWADDMQDVHCQECDTVLTDAEAELAWPQ